MATANKQPEKISSFNAWKSGDVKADKYSIPDRWTERYKHQVASSVGVCADFRSPQIISLIAFPKLQIFIFSPALKEPCDNMTPTLRHRRDTLWGLWKQTRWRVQLILCGGCAEGNEEEVEPRQDMWGTQSSWLWFKWCYDKGDRITMNPKHWLFLTWLRCIGPSHTVMFGSQLTI